MGFPKVGHFTTPDRELQKTLRDIISYLEPSPITPGRVFYAVDSTEDYYDELYDRLYKEYDDGVGNIYTTIQSAVDATVDERGDLIWVFPKKWQESVLILDKDAIKIRAVAPGWITQMRPGDATTKYGCTPVGGSAIGAFAFAVLSRSVEISGFLCDGGGGYGGIYVGDGYNISTSYDENSASARLYNNVFRGGGEGVYGLVMDGCSDDVQVLANRFTRNTAAGIYITPGGSRTVQRPLIYGNFFRMENASYGIDMYSHGTTQGVQIIGNHFADGSGDTATYAVRCQGAGVHNIADNTFACTNKISASATDFCSGNKTSSAGNSPTYVEEE